jgi:hypothetical protein
MRQAHPVEQMPSRLELLVGSVLGFVVLLALCVVLPSAA